ncbi:MAG: hypothetical protein IJJ23_04195 [Clostridia bacterium]|nr:hypothetical protein [Clostridia bacterium]
MRLSYSATEHPENYAEKLYNTPGAGEYATAYWQRVADQAKGKDCFTIDLK